METHASGVWGRKRSSWAIWAAWGAVAGLFYLALRATPLDRTLKTLDLLEPEQIAALIAVNALILGGMALRWLLILRSMQWRRASLIQLLAYRLVGFGVSFFTPGPQFGGEPVQVDLLSRRERAPLAVAVSSVYLDRLLDLLANFTFLALGAAVALLNGFAAGAWVWGVVVGVLALPLGHLALLHRGKYPAAWLVARLARGRETDWWRRAGEVTREAEERIAGLCRDQPGRLAAWIGLSGAIWGLMIVEYGLTLRFLGADPSPVEVILALTAGRLALLMPIPGGLGALEASQVLATQALGWGPQVGLALSLVVRARDFLLALFGIAYGALAYQSAARHPAPREERPIGD